MKHRSSHISARSRILLISVLAIIVPTFVLSLFGFQLIYGEERYREARYATALRVGAELTAERVAEEVEASEKKLIESLPLHDLDALRQRLEEIEKTSGLVEQAFVVDANDQVLYPVTELPALVQPKARMPGADDLMVPSILSEGYSREFSHKNLAEALELYRQYKQRILEWYQKDQNAAAEAARAIHVLASALFKAKQFERSITEYSLLLKNPEYEKWAFQFTVLGRYQIAQAHLELGNRSEAFRQLVGLYGFLVNVTPRAGDAPLIEYYKARALKDIDSLHAAGLDGTRATLDLLKKQEARRRQRMEFLDDVKNWWQHRRKLISTTTNVLQHSSPREFGVESTVVSYMTVRLRTDDAERSLLGFKLNLSHVVQNIVVPKFRATDFGAPVSVSVMDETQRLVYGAAAPKDAKTVMVAFPKLFNFWQMHVSDSDPQSSRRLARKLTIVYASLNIVIVAVVVAGVYLTIRDMNRELQLSKLKSNFVSSVSHELKTPLALIRMFSETLLLGRVKDERKQEYYNVINKESERLTALINNVLDFSKIDAGRRSYDMNPANIADVVENTLAAYQHELRKQGFEVEADLEPDMPDSVMDDDAIAQALLNLLNNAVKYSGEKKSIKVSARHKDGLLYVSVTDHGIGIDKQEQSKVFEMFYRGSSENVRATRGTGLGLAITKHTIEAHGGSVTLESVKGQGSTFTIILPVRSAAGPAAAGSSVARGGRPDRQAAQ